MSFGRRDFLALSGAAALSEALASTLIRPRLGFQVYGVRDMCAEDFEGTLRAARAIGYEGVETGRFYGRNAKELNALMRSVGLELLALQLYPHRLAGASLADTIRFCHECGCRRVNTAWFKGSAENENDWQLVVNVLNHAAEVCAKEGIEIAYHNHDQELLVRFGGKTALEWLYERFSPLVKQELDPGWCVLAGCDPMEWLRAHPRRNPCVHVMPAIADAAGLMPGQCGVGSARDRAEWSRILPALAADGTQWLVVKPTAHPGSIKDLKSSYEHLKGIA